MMGALKLYARRALMTRRSPPCSSVSMSRNNESAICSKPKYPKSKRARFDTSSRSPSCCAFTPINEALVRALASGGYIAQSRNVVLVGGAGTGKTHLAIAIARSCIRAGSRGRFFKTVDLVNRLEAEARATRQGRLADYLTRLDFIVLDELGRLPFAQAGGQWLFHLISRLYKQPRSSSRPILPSESGPASSATQK